MSRTFRFLGFSSAAALTTAAGVCAAVYFAPEIAVSTPSQAASVVEEHTDPAPQRFEVAQATTTTGGNTGAALPGGASSLNETYKDWRVLCAQQGTAKRCSISQVQAQQNGQRVLALELNALAGNSVSGVLILPFGLALDSGVSLQIDEKPVMPALRFRTCLPAGCVVTVSFDAPTLVALRAGSALKVKAVADGGAPAPFSVSLQGFATALDRMGALAR